MRTFYFFISAIAFLMLSSCNDGSTIITTSEYSSLREASNMSIAFVTTAQQNVNINTAKITATYLSDHTIEIKTNAGMDDEQIFYSTSFTVSEPNDEIKIINNPGLSQVVYFNKNSLSATTNEQASITATILNGAINTSATSIIIEESDSL